MLMRLAQMVVAFIGGSACIALAQFLDPTGEINGYSVGASALFAALGFTWVVTRIQDWWTFRRQLTDTGLDKLVAAATAIEEYEKATSVGRLGDGRDS